MRPMSVNSDLREAVRSLCEDATACGLDMDQVASVIRDELAAIERDGIYRPCRDCGGTENRHVANYYCKSYKPD